MRLNSLRVRVTAWYVGLLAAALLAFGGALYFAAQSYLTTRLERALSGEAQAIAANFVSHEEQRGLAWMSGEIIEAYAPEQSGRFVRVTRQDGEVMYQSGDAKDPPIHVAQISKPGVNGAKEGLRHESGFGEDGMIVFSLTTTTSSGTRYLVEVGSTQAQGNRVLRSLWRILLVITPLILLTAAFGGFLLMSRPLRPLVALAQHAERIGTHELGERLPVIATGDEMERLSLSLNRMISRLEDALNHDRRFSADVSHELRTPLTILRGELEQMVQARELPVSMREGVGSALEEIDRLTKIVENLLAIARVDAGTDATVRQRVDLAAMAQWVVDQMHLLADEKGITLHCRKREAGGEAVTLGDPARLKQVLVNLLDNAIKYTPEGGEIAVTVSVGMSRKDERAVVLEVRDTGIGIPPESLPHVFQRFYRSDKARSRESGGTGLGLSIVQSICHAHEGTVDIQSAEGVGTLVRVELPLAPVQEAGAKGWKSFSLAST